MSVKPFLTLKEIDSLTKMRNAQLNAKIDQESRLHKLNDKRQGIEEEIQISKKEIVLQQTLLGQIEDKIKTATQQRERLIELGGDEIKIQTLSKGIETLEDQGFAYLTKIDELESGIKENKTFLEGLLKTIDEINGEVSDAVTKIQDEVKNLDLRLELLLLELPEDFKSLLNKVSAKKLAHGPFTRIDQRSCYFCRFKISRIEESEIDMQKNLKTCPQCTRIFLPYGA